MHYVVTQDLALGMSLFSCSKLYILSWVYWAVPSFQEIKTQLLYILFTG